MSDGFECVPPTEWAARIAATRQRGAEAGYQTDQRPLSAYEPCERCGRRVLGAEKHGRRSMVDIYSMNARGTHLKLLTAPHRCRPRAKPCHQPGVNQG